MQRERSGEFFKVFRTLFPEDKEKTMREITFQVTENCNLKCSYCYQIAKTTEEMQFETAKKLIDSIIDNYNNPSSIWNEKNTSGFIFDFIGGEPLLKIELIEQICDYITNRLLILDGPDCPWLLHHMFSMSSNGTLYFTPKVQSFIKKFNSYCSIGITVDGNKELHDACRVFKENNKGSYDLAIQAALAERERGIYSTKLTFSPDNISYVSDGTINLIQQGFDVIYGNTVFESGWTEEKAKEYYLQLKKICNYLLENNLENKCYIRFLNPENFSYYSKESLLKNYCGVSENCTMIALDSKGNIYPCIRFMPSSLGDCVKPIILGNVNSKNFSINNLVFPKELLNINTKNFSSEECINCSIGKNCAWCTAYCYQEQKKFDHRTTYHCLTHVAEAAAAKYLQIKSKNELNLIKLPNEKAKRILPKEDYYLLEKEE